MASLENIEAEDKNLVSTAYITFIEKCSVELDKDVFNRWCVVGVKEALPSDSAIARFLIQQYEKIHSGEHQETMMCVICKLPVRQLCVRCMQSSNMPPDSKTQLNNHVAIQEAERFVSLRRPHSQDLSLVKVRAFERENSFQLQSVHIEPRSDASHVMQITDANPSELQQNFVEDYCRESLGVHEPSKQFLEVFEDGSIEPLMHAATGAVNRTVNSTGGCMHMGVVTNQFQSAEENYAETDEGGVHFVPEGNVKTPVVNTLVPAATSTGNSISGCMHKGVNILTSNTNYTNVQTQSTDNHILEMNSHTQSMNLGTSYVSVLESGLTPLCTQSPVLVTVPEAVSTKDLNYQMPGIEAKTLISPKSKTRGKRVTVNKSKKQKRKPSGDNPKEAVEDRNKNHSCELCGTAFYRRSNLISHMIRHGVTTPHKCKLCPAAFKRYKELRAHDQDVHDGARKFYDCSLCGTTFKHMYKLTEHMRRHTGERPFLCDICGQGFICAADRTIHRRTHTGERPFQCSVCGKTFHRSTCLSFHKRSHELDRSHICTQCGRGFRHEFQLKKHMIVHTDLRPFQCEVCGKAMAHKSTLKYHMRTHTGQKPYSCPVCGKAFGTSSNMQAHRRTHTKHKQTESDFSTNRVTTSQ